MACLRGRDVPQGASLAVPGAALAGRVSTQLLSRVRRLALRSAHARGGRYAGGRQPRPPALTAGRPARLAGRALGDGARQLAAADAGPALGRVPRVRAQLAVLALQYVRSIPAYAL